MARFLWWGNRSGKRLSIEAAGLRRVALRGPFPAPRAPKPARTRGRAGQPQGGTGLFRPSMAQFENREGRRAEVLPRIHYVQF